MIMNTLCRLRLDSPGVRGNQHLDDGEEFGRAPLPRGQWEEEDTHHEGGLGFLHVLPSDRASKVSEPATNHKSQKRLFASRTHRLVTLIIIAKS